MWVGLKVLQSVFFADVNNILKVLDKLAPAMKDRQKDIQFLKEFVNSNDFRTLMKV